MDTKNLVPLLLFSGGLDSTYMLQLALEQGDVDTLYIEGCQGGKKAKMELAARRKIIDVLQKKTGHRVKQDYIVNSGDYLSQTPDYTFAQPLTWLVGAISVIDGHRHSSMHVGYLFGDQINCYLTDIKQAWESIMRFSKRIQVPIEFPMKLKSKQTILDRMYPEVVRLTWMCELPRADYDYHTRAVTGYHQCGRCPSCLTMFAQLQIWEHTNDRNYNDYIDKCLTEQSSIDQAPISIRQKISFYQETEEPTHGKEYPTSPDNEALA